MGAVFEIVTNQRALKYLKLQLNDNLQFAWVLSIIAKYNFTISYWKGGLNVVADALSQPLKALTDVERGYRYVLNLRPAIWSKNALFKKDAAYQAATKAPRVVEQPAAKPIAAPTAEPVAVLVTVPADCADRQHSPRTSQQIAQLDSSDEEEQPPDVIHDMVDIAEGCDHTDNSSDSSEAQMPDAIQQATAIAGGQDVMMDYKFKSVRKELVNLGINDPLDATAEDLEHLGLNPLQQNAEELQVVLLRPDAKLPVRKHADDVGFNVASVDGCLLVK
ncbi:hypothetical protein H4S08_004746, partial [Coemansia sp. RSA 1365]